MYQKRSQNAVEFLLLTLFVMTVFILFLSFFQSQFGEVQIAQEKAFQKQIVDSVINQIILASQSKSGYQTTFFVANEHSSTNYNISLVSHTDIVLLNLDDNNQQVWVEFLPSRYRVHGNLCMGQNQILTSREYGVGICCESCDEFPYESSEIECRTSDSTFWKNCLELQSAQDLVAVRVQCNFGDVSAELEIKNSTDTVFSDSLQLGRIIYQNVSWFGTDDISLQIESNVYEFNYSCVDSRYSNTTTYAFT